MHLSLSHAAGFCTFEGFVVDGLYANRQANAAWLDCLLKPTTMVIEEAIWLAKATLSVT